MKYILVLWMTVALIGCDCGEPNAPVTQPTSAPVVHVEAAAGVMDIDGQAVGFGPAVLQLVEAGEGMTAELMSTDPPDRAEASNAFYLPMELEIPDAGKIDGAQWDYKATSDERSESPVGLFVNNGLIKLQPLEVKVEFTGSGPLVSVTFTGRFIVFDLNNEATPPRVVEVAGRFPAAVENR